MSFKSRLLRMLAVLLEEPEHAEATAGPSPTTSTIRTAEVKPTSDRVAAIRQRRQEDVEARSDLYRREASALSSRREAALAEARERRDYELGKSVDLLVRAWHQLPNKIRLHWEDAANGLGPEAGCPSYNDAAKQRDERNAAIQVMYEQEVSDIHAASSHAVGVAYAEYSVGEAKAQRAADEEIAALESAARVRS